MTVSILFNFYQLLSNRLSFSLSIFSHKLNIERQLFSRTILYNIHVSILLHFLIYKRPNPVRSNQIDKFVHVCCNLINHKGHQYQFIHLCLVTWKLFAFRYYTDQVSLNAIMNSTHEPVYLNVVSVLLGMLWLNSVKFYFKELKNRLIRSVVENWTLIKF